MSKKLLLILLLSASFAFTVFAAETTFTGSISDDMCGFTHMMKGMSPKDCVEACIKSGSKYVLADSAHKIIYALDDQTRVKSFSGQEVVITGELAKDGKMIHVNSVNAAPGKSK